VRRLFKSLNTLFITAFLAAPLSVNAGVISLVDDTYLEQSLDFDFTFFGKTYNNVFVGSNGFLTFGSGSYDYVQKVDKFLRSEPKIAIWDDFDLRSTGTINITSTASYFKVGFDLVPQFGNSDQNSFDITIFSDNSIELFFKDLSTTDMLVGITAGNDIGSAVDFSTARVWSNLETSYQLFDGDFDLQGQTIRFESQSVPVPEPSSVLFLALGFIAIRAVKKRKTA